MSVVLIHGRDADAFAKSVLHQLLERGDVAGRDADGRSVLQLSVDDWLLEELGAFEADAAELEDADGEPEPDQEVDGPATVLDFVPPKRIGRASRALQSFGARPIVCNDALRGSASLLGARGSTAAHVDRTDAAAVLPDLPQGAALWRCLYQFDQAVQEGAGLRVLGIQGAMSLCSG